MSFSARRARSPIIQAEISLLPIKSCLVNLPPNVANVLNGSDTAVQDVIVELEFQFRDRPNTSGRETWRKIYAGWTGMPSKARLTSIVPRKGSAGSQNVGGNEPAIPFVEIDASFARSLGLEEGQNVTVSLHLDPALVNVVSIEPATTEDWEIIELHATFLEINLLSQIRAIPNPNFISQGAAVTPHLLTLHLSPTSTANVLVQSIEPLIDSSIAFARISPNAEVIVAPKKRRQPQSIDKDSKSLSNISRGADGSRGKRSTTSTEDHEEILFLRAVNRSIGEDWFRHGDVSDRGLCIWLDRDLLVSKLLRGSSFALVSIVTLRSSIQSVDPQPQENEHQESKPASEQPTKKVVVKLKTWVDAPDSLHAGLSKALCDALQFKQETGGIIQIETAPLQLPKSAVNSLIVFPYSSSNADDREIRIGGDHKTAKTELIQKLRYYYGETEYGNGIFSGPLTDGMEMPSLESASPPFQWRGGILRFNRRPKNTSESADPHAAWMNGVNQTLEVKIEADIHLTNKDTANDIAGLKILRSAPALVGISTLSDSLMSHLLHKSSVLLTGSTGSGKSALAQSVACQLQKQHLFSTTFFSCNSLTTDESRVSYIKEIINQLLLSSSWGARNGGKALLILDDLDKVCPAETELQVGGENGRSRQISELLKALVRQYVKADSNITLLITAQSKEALNSVVVGGHLVQETLVIKSPSKDQRRELLHFYTQESSSQISERQHALEQPISNGLAGNEHHSPDENTTELAVAQASGFRIDSRVDLLRIAGFIDGFVPADIKQLIDRARSEAVIRDVEVDNHNAETNNKIIIDSEDFDKALKGFVPAALRNISLQTSTTKFDSIGGLQKTRKLLLETLQYPTKYAPIFAQCPLRLRSGLLLYGFPGCGKTMLASAVAGECGLNFISVKGPEILNKYIGASEKSVRDLFERAEAAKPCVLFFDEFDSIAPKRGHDSTGVTDRVVNQLLTQMDGAEGLSGVYVLAATSRPDLIDSALLRPGRLDKSILCDMPNTEDRLDILRAIGKNLKMTEEVLDVVLEKFAERTEGFTGADLQALVYNAHLEAIHDVLDDREAKVQFPKQDRKRENPRHRRRFDHFNYESEEDSEETGPSQTDHARKRRRDAVIRAKVTSQLEAIELSQKKGRKSGFGDQKELAKEVIKSNDDVVINWEHLKRALETTKSSITPQERQRLHKIYVEFAIGRNGDMPTGDGSTEVGGRTSLM